MIGFNKNKNIKHEYIIDITLKKDRNDIMSYTKKTNNKNKIEYLIKSSSKSFYKLYKWLSSDDK